MGSGFFLRSRFKSQPASFLECLSMSCLGIDFFILFFFFCGKYICLFTEEPKKTGWWCFRKIVWKCKSNSLCEDYFSCWYNCLFWTYWWLWVYSPFQLTYFHLMSELSMRVCSCITYSWEGVYLDSLSKTGNIFFIQWEYLCSNSYQIEMMLKYCY